MLLTLKPLLSSIVDYAGLFPPAQLSLSKAVRVYDRAQSSPYHWLLGRFVLPASRLPEFVTLLENVPNGYSRNWPLSVILSQNWAAEIELVCQLQAANHHILISLFEVVPLPPAAIHQLCSQVPQGVNTFFELPWETDIDPYLTLLQQVRAGAKLRTGGITHEAFPTSTQLGQQIIAFAKAKIPFKATAGLHHPLRSQHHLTDAPNSASTTMHGFLNVALLAALAYHQKVTLDDAIALLEEHSIHSFQFTEAAIHWRDYSCSLAELEQSRQQFFHSFGSCSIQAPIDDLQTLRLL
ncbi:MAG TPA: hypothetical protein IGS53_21610 [Leptolyngbyaceae cyanobacterium M33_DOE_097]|uniref:Uncharacterized protein n=1 Tax=Oscillatoriales cyanobacterium SpSt-418 TaxID=2282169 RepID=A0A7C3PQF7_9CYAN|nr:hypothetical protein [Leptolyngbyaceae cyanobacterium M33_DOE_097]